MMNAEFQIECSIIHFRIQNSEFSIAMIGVISDTHGLLRPEAVDALRGCERIIHAGDVGSPFVLDQLRGIAPVVAVRGNVDSDSWAAKLPRTAVVEFEGHAIYVLHIVAELDRNPPPAGISAVVYGHSHKPSIDERAGVLYLNPGAAGPRRFKLPVSVALMSIYAGRLTARIVELETPGHQKLSHK
jgi:putative phosphoesterase